MARRSRRSSSQNRVGMGVPSSSKGSLRMTTGSPPSSANDDLEVPLGLPPEQGGHPGPVVAHVGQRLRRDRRRRRRRSTNTTATTMAIGPARLAIEPPAVSIRLTGSASG